MPISSYVAEVLSAGKVCQISIIYFETCEMQLQFYSVLTAVCIIHLDIFRNHHAVLVQFKNTQFMNLDAVNITLTVIVVFIADIQCLPILFHVVNTTNASLHTSVNVTCPPNENLSTGMSFVESTCDLKGQWLPDIADCTSEWYSLQIKCNDHLLHNVSNFQGFFQCCKTSARKSWHIWMSKTIHKRS